MKKFLKKYGYILLVVVIAAGCYTGFRAFRYYYHDTDDYCLRTYGTHGKGRRKVWENRAAAYGKCRELEQP